MASAFSTIGMVPSIMPRRHSPPCLGWMAVRATIVPPRQLLTPHPLELDFDKSNEILFRLGIIYKQQCKYDESLACFDRILRSPPSPLAHADIWFQIGHVYEQQKDVSSCPTCHTLSFGLTINL